MADRRLVAAVLLIALCMIQKSTSDTKTSPDGFSYVDRLAQIEEDLVAQGIYLKAGEDSPSARMARFKKPSKEALELSLKNQQSLESLRGSSLPNEQLDSVNLLSDRQFTLVNTSCLPEPLCPPSNQYRQIDGSCNNPRIKNSGKSSTVYRRYKYGALYSDGKQAPRLAASGAPLPSARLVSNIVFRQTVANGDSPNRAVTSSLTQFGQFINHDLAATNQFSFKFYDNTEINCCSSQSTILNPTQTHPACFPIAVPPGDVLATSSPLPQGLQPNCMNFVRSLTGPRDTCLEYGGPQGAANQLNSNTHWLDGSAIYGSTDAVARSLRSFSGGLLKMVIVDSSIPGKTRSLLPLDPNGPCSTSVCFTAGDSRVNEQPQLTVMHTVWAREHNRIAKQLSIFNPTWNDEKLYQEARRIVIAELQHITYNEFLPTLIGSVAVGQWSLYLARSGYATSYWETVPYGIISNEFATAAFRVGHSLVQGRGLLYDESGNLLPSSYNLSSRFNDASALLYDRGFIDNAIRGMVTQPPQTADQMIADALWLELFKSSSARFGFDLAALNIQRGRDHGLHIYKYYRYSCGFSWITSFEQLWNPALVGPGQPMMDPTVVSWLSSVYASVDDIDLYVGLVAELPPKPATATSGLVGPTAACLIGETFKKLRYADHYFYDRYSYPAAFSPDFLNEIRNASLARIYCDNNDGTVQKMQPKAFLPVDCSTNARVPCDSPSIPSVNLQKYRG